eukprot:4418191-Amphidinium_carterae.1
MPASTSILGTLTSLCRWIVQKCNVTQRIVTIVHNPLCGLTASQESVGSTKGTSRAGNKRVPCKLAFKIEIDSFFVAETKRCELSAEADDVGAQNYDDGTRPCNSSQRHFLKTYSRVPTGPQGNTSCIFV